MALPINKKAAASTLEGCRIEDVKLLGDDPDPITKHALERHKKVHLRYTLRKRKCTKYTIIKITIT